MEAFRQNKMEKVERKARKAWGKVHHVFRVDLRLGAIRYQRQSKAGKPKLQPEQLLGLLEAWGLWDAEAAGSQLSDLPFGWSTSYSLLFFRKDMVSVFPTNLTPSFPDTPLLGSSCTRRAKPGGSDGLAHMHVCTSASALTEKDKSRGPSTGWCSLMSKEIYPSEAYISKSVLFKRIRASGWAVLCQWELVLTF